MSTSKAAEKRLQSIDLYSSENRPAKAFSGVRLYLEDLFPSVKVSVRSAALKHVPKNRIARCSEALAAARMKNPLSSEQTQPPMFGEIDYERRSLLGKSKVGGIVYDGREIEEILVGLLARRSDLKTASVIFTDRLVSTYSRDDLRHHLRTLICGFPSIVSLPGIVEAPAKPREYYFMRQRMESEGAGDIQLQQLKSAFRGRFVDYDDPELFEVSKGLALQAVLYHLTLDPFCENKRCRFFNAHWQEDLIISQAPGTRMCKKHASQMRSLCRKPVVSW